MFISASALPGFLFLSQCRNVTYMLEKGCWKLDFLFVVQLAHLRPFRLKEDWRAFTYTGQQVENGCSSLLLCETPRGEAKERYPGSSQMTLDKGPHGLLKWARCASGPCCCPWMCSQWSWGSPERFSSPRSGQLVSAWPGHSPGPISCID